MQTTPPAIGVVRCLRAAGSIRVGAVLCGGIVVYLAVVSVFSETSANMLRTTPEGLYGHWSLVGLGIALMVNITLATVLRLPLRIDALGAWCSHLGVLVAAAGCLWYVSAAVRGQCLTERTAAGWTPITDFYEQESLALYAAASGGTGEMMTPLPALDGADSRETIPLDVPVAAPAGVALRVTGLVRHPVVMRSWANDSPNPSPGVRLEVRDGQEATDPFVLCPTYPGARQRAGDGFVIVYHSGVSGDHLQRLAAPSDTAGGPGIPHDILLVVTGPEIPPTAVVISPAGGRWTGVLQPERALTVPVAGGKIHLVLKEILTHAAPHDRAMSAPSLSHRELAALVDVAAGDFRRSTCVVFGAFPTEAPSQYVDIPGGRIGLTLSRKRIALPAMLQVDKALFETQRASRVPKNYTCDVTISAGDRTRRDIVRLNEPVRIGPYQISQGSWDNRDLQDPQWIMLLVATRPGLGLIWIGCAMMCLGFPFAFYVKPLLRRRRKGWR